MCNKQILGCKLEAPTLEFLNKVAVLVALFIHIRMCSCAHDPLYYSH